MQNKIKTYPTQSRKETAGKIVDEIKQLSVHEVLVLVEGKNDKKALEQLGLKRIATLNCPLYKTIETASVEKSVAILTDLDREGIKKYSYLHHHLSARGVKIKNKLRNLLSRAGICHIEGLSGFIKHNLPESTEYNQYKTNTN